MERRELCGIVLKVFSDSVFNISYIRVLTDSCVEVFKINGCIESFSFAHVLNPQYKVCIEVIKTRKNWILKDVLHFQRLTYSDSYSNILKLTELVSVLTELLTDGQEVSILPWVEEVFCNPHLESISIDAFKKDSAMRLNFKIDK